MGYQRVSLSDLVALALVLKMSPAQLVDEALIPIAGNKGLSAGTTSTILFDVPSAAK
jgi:hypothetical protein